MSDQLPPVGATQTAAHHPTVIERADAAKRRGQALIGAAAGLAVIAVLIGTFIWVQNSEEKIPTVAAPVAPSAEQPAAEPPPAEPSAGAEPPAAPPPAAPAPPKDLNPALTKKPTVGAGGPTLTKLAVKPLVKGSGPAVAKGQTITVNYVLVSYVTGKEIEASWSTGQPVQLQIGVGRVIPGWDQGLVGVPVGSRVQLDIPADLAYGDSGQGEASGPLRFVVDILGAQ